MERWGADTLGWYAENAGRFFDDTIAVDLTPLHERFLALVPAGRHFTDATEPRLRAWLDGIPAVDAIQDWTTPDHRARPVKKIRAFSDRPQARRSRPRSQPSASLRHLDPVSIEHRPGFEENGNSHQ